MNQAKLTQKLSGILQIPAIRHLVCVILFYSGLVYLWKRLANKGRPIIVYYHEITGENDDTEWCREKSLLLSSKLFYQQLAYLNQHYRIVRLDERLYSEAGNVIAVTFDDGFRGVYKRAFPILKEMKIPATVFLITDFVGTAELPWWENLLQLLEEFLLLPEETRRIAIGRSSDKWRQLLAQSPSRSALLNAYRAAASRDRNELTEILLNACGSINRHVERIFLSMEEIREMSASGVSFGAHTKTHPLLTWLEADELMEEMRTSKEEVLRLTRDTECWFAYPDGIFGERERALAEKMGFVGTVQTFRNPDDSGSFAVPRIGLKEYSSFGVCGRFSRAMMEVSLSDISKRRIKLFASSWLNRIK